MTYRPQASHYHATTMVSANTQRLTELRREIAVVERFITILEDPSVHVEVEHMMAMGQVLPDTPERDAFYEMAIELLRDIAASRTEAPRSKRTRGIRIKHKDKIRMRRVMQFHQARRTAADADRWWQREYDAAMARADAEFDAGIEAILDGWGRDFRMPVLSPHSPLTVPTPTPTTGG